MLIWFLYPIAWGVADGGNVISPLGEMVFYGILDVLAKPVFCFYHAWALRGVPYERFMLSSGKASMGYAAAGATGAGVGEKGRMSTASNAPLTNNGAGGHSAGTGPTAGQAADTTAGPAGTAPGAAGGPLNGRHGLTHRNSGRNAAEQGTL
jgi:hypothetical protein